MKMTDLTKVDLGARGNAMKMAFIIAGALTLTACINVKAPDKPIEINLNVNIKQEVVVSLKKDAQDLIKEHPELFPS
jgi:hypothetical protein